MKVTVLNKKTLTIIGLVVILVIAAIINMQLTKNKNNVQTETNNQSEESVNQEEEVTTSAQGNSITVLNQYEAERKIDRQKELQYLEELIDDDQTDDETRQLATQQKMGIMENIQIEQVITEVLVGKGFEQVVVVCGSDSVNVLVDGTGLDDAKVAQILDVAVREAEAEADNVKIIPLD